MMGKTALIVRGGYEDHDPEKIAIVFEKELVSCGFQVEISDTLDAYLDVEKLKSLSLIIPIWTMGNITGEQADGVFQAVGSGVGLAGCHGGMCDAFRDNLWWQYMTGGQFVDHPGGTVEYTVNMKKGSSSITEGIEDFKVMTEQYYLLVDPAVQVLATTYCIPRGNANDSNGVVKMPVIWTKRWDKGRVFFNSLGHNVEIVKQEPILTLMRRGFLWASEGKELSN